VRAAAWRYFQHANYTEASRKARAARHIFRLQKNKNWDGNTHAHGAHHHHLVVLDQPRPRGDLDLLLHVATSAADASADPARSNEAPVAAAIACGFLNPFVCSWWVETRRWEQT